MPLTSKYKQQLKAQAHSLHPIVMLGANGLTDAVNAEIERALLDHELIKIKVGEKDRAARKELINEICQTHQAELVQAIGLVAVIYKKNPKK
jgi:RNA-binding protein